MKTYVQPGRTITVTAPAGGVASGDLVLIGALIGVANGDAAAGEPVEITLEGVFTLPKLQALAIDVGDKLYWSTADAWVTKTNTDVLIGVAVSAAANPSDTVNVRLSVQA